MNKQTFPVTIARRALVSFVLIAVVLFFAAMRVSAQASQLNLADVLTALRSKKATAAEKNRLLTDGVRKRGITFALTPEIEKELRAVGAGNTLLAAIRAKSPLAKQLTAQRKVAPVKTPAPTVALEKFRQRANQSVATGDFESALTDFDRAIKLSPADASLYLGRSSAYAALGRDELALADLDRAAEAEPGSPTILTRRAAVFEKLNNPEFALMDYRRVLELDPSNPVAGAAVGRLEAKFAAANPPTPRVIVVQNNSAKDANIMSGVKSATVVRVGALNAYTDKLAKPTLTAGEKVSAGVVTVEITLDERGLIESATAVSGPQNLRNAAQDAVRRTRFKPVMVDGKPVRATGHISFNFR